MGEASAADTSTRPPHVGATRRSKLELGSGAGGSSCRGGAGSSAEPLRWCTVRSRDGWRGGVVDSVANAVASGGSDAAGGGNGDSDVGAVSVASSGDGDGGANAVASGSGGAASGGNGDSDAGAVGGASSGDGDSGASAVASGSAASGGNGHAATGRCTPAR